MHKNEVETTKLSIFTPLCPLHSFFPPYYYFVYSTKIAKFANDNDKEFFLLICEYDL